MSGERVILLDTTAAELARREAGPVPDDLAAMPELVPRWLEAAAVELGRRRGCRCAWPAVRTLLRPADPDDDDQRRVCVPIVSHDPQCVVVADRGTAVAVVTVWEMEVEDDSTT